MALTQKLPAVQKGIKQDPGQETADERIRKLLFPSGLSTGLPKTQEPSPVSDVVTAPATPELIFKADRERRIKLLHSSEGLPKDEWDTMLPQEQKDLLSSSEGFSTVQRADKSLGIQAFESYTGEQQFPGLSSENLLNKISGGVTSAINTPLFRIGNYGVSASDIINIAAFAYGGYQALTKGFAPKFNQAVADAKFSEMKATIGEEAASKKVIAQQTWDFLAQDMRDYPVETKQKIGWGLSEFAKQRGIELTEQDKTIALDWFDKNLKTKSELSKMINTIFRGERGSGELIPYVGGAIQKIGEVTQAVGKTYSGAASAAGAEIMNILVKGSKINPPKTEQPILVGGNPYLTPEGKFTNPDLTHIEAAIKQTGSGDIYKYMGQTGNARISFGKYELNVEMTKLPTAEQLVGIEKSAAGGKIVYDIANSEGLILKSGVANDFNQFKAQLGVKIEPRVALAQISSKLLSGGDSPEAVAHYEKLYSTVPGYNKAADFWEPPTWTAEASKTFPNSDLYVIRNVADAVKYLNAAGYDKVMFSAMDSNVDIIKQIAAQYKGDIIVGGYVPADSFKDLPNVKFVGSIEGAAKEAGVPYQAGVDYAKFAGTSSVPRLCLSTGCLHNCAFCDIPKTIKQITPAVIQEQIDQIAKMNPQLVYINDKTFGQAKNYAKLIDAGEQLAKKAPAFQGFIVQTTAARFTKFDAEFLQKARIKYVEIGVESFNNKILKAIHKPATEKLIVDAMQHARETGVKIIPNIMIGLPGETAETYAKTLKMLKDNSDVISHLNIYNTAVYSGTELADTLGVKAPTDALEGAVKKSWHDNEAIHEQFAKDIYALGGQLLDNQGTYKITGLAGQGDWELPKSTIRDIIAAHDETGGASFDLNTGKNLSGQTGFAVAKFPGKNAQLNTTKVTPEELLKYITDNQDELRKPGNFLGTWQNNNGGTDLDVSARVESLGGALDLARGESKWTYIEGVGQVAVHDLVTHTDIKVPYVDDYIKKIEEIIAARDPQWENQAILQRQELGVRIANYQKIYNELAPKIGANQARLRALEALHGEMPTYDSLVKGNMSKEDKDYLVSYLRSVFAEGTETFKFVNACTALDRIYAGQLLRPFEVTLMEEAFGSEFAKKVLAPPTTGQKIVKVVLDVLSLPTSLVSSTDFSAIITPGGIQGVNHPLVMGKAITDMVKATFSEKAYIAFRRWLMFGRDPEVQAILKQCELARKPLFLSPTMRLSKAGQKATAREPLQQVAGASKETSLFEYSNRREESFLSSLGDYIPIVSQSQRGYNVLLDSIRAHRADTVIRQMLDAGMTWKENSKDFMAFTSYMNVTTGRGDLGELTQAAPILNRIMFSARRQASVFQTPPMLFSRSESVRKLAWKEIGTALITGLSVLGLAALAGAEVETNAKSSDFGQIKVGDSRINIWGAYRSYFTFLAREITGSKKSSTDRITPINRWDTFVSFARGKAAPGVGLIINAMAGKDVVGNEVSVEDPASVGAAVLRSITPMALQDVLGALQTDGVGTDLGLSLSSIVGFGFQNYDSTSAIIGDMNKTLSLMQPYKTAINKFVEANDSAGLVKYLKDNKDLPQNSAQMTEWENARLALSKANSTIVKLDKAIAQVDAIKGVPKEDKQAARIKLELAQATAATNALLMYDYFMQRFDILQGRAKEQPVMPTLKPIDFNSP